MTHNFRRCVDVSIFAPYIYPYSVYWKILIVFMKSYLTTTDNATARIADIHFLFTTTSYKRLALYSSATCSERDILRPSSSLERPVGATRAAARI